MKQTEMERQKDRETEEEKEKEGNERRDGEGESHSTEIFLYNNRCTDKLALFSSMVSATGYAKTQTM